MMISLQIFSALSVYQLVQSMSTVHVAQDESFEISKQQNISK